MNRFVSGRAGSASAGAVLLWLVAGWAAAAWPPPIPAQAQLSVRNLSADERTDEMVRGGIPIPRERNLLNTSGLALVDASGVPVPASFRVLARWNAGRDVSSAPIQWLLVRFQASVPGNATRNYRLVLDGGAGNPAPSIPLQLSANGQQWVVDTGVAQFRIGADPLRVFDRIELADGTVVVNSSQALAQVNGNQMGGFAQLRRIQIEHADALSAVILIEGEYAHPMIGGGAISGGRRYEFAAGSSAVTVREWIDWEGQLCGVGELVCGSTPNAVALQRWRIGLSPSLSGTRSIGVQAALGQPLSTAVAPAGTSASLRQLRRADRFAAQRYELDLPGLAQLNGTRADAAVALYSGNEGSIGIAIRAMADYEPQALRLLADGSLALDLADAPVWLGARQGTFAEYRVGVYPPGASSAGSSAALWSALNQPLLALAAPQWVAASQATDEFPVGTLPAELASYDTTLQDLIARTSELRRARGLEGLMTFGLYPRNWGNPVLSDEIDCGADPTPADDWDDPYWCAFWTDYHNTTASAFVAAWRYADPAPLHALSAPAAMRQLHTQMIRCAPDDNYFYCGQIPAGYGGYRVDFNSSHQYIENLILNYWMSGDQTIVERLQDGARSYRGYLCPARGSIPPGPVCAADAPIVDTFAGVNDRVAAQFYQIFRFVALAGDDASYLDDWRSNSARFLSQNFALVQSAGTELGFTEPSGGGSLDYITGPGTYYTNQLWMASIYDFNMLYRWQVDSQDAVLGIPAITPSRARDGWARTLLATATLPPGDGTPGGIWPNQLRYTFSGARIGGNLTSMEPGWVPQPMPMPCFDECLYDEGKSTLTATLARSADDLADTGLRTLAMDLTRFALDRISERPLPMGKSPGESFGRLSSAVARLARSGAEVAIFADSFEE